MDAELLLFVLVLSVAGSLLGAFTGLVPGIHVNTLAALLLIAYPVLMTGLSSMFPADHVPILVASCIVSAAVVHSFVDFVPSVFLGAPDPDEVLNMLPGHRMLMDGDGMNAVRSAAIGSVVGTAAAILASIPLHMLLTAGLGDYMESLTLIVLIVVVLILVSSENGVNMIWAAALLLISGILGTVCMFYAPPLNGLIPGGDLLFPLLTGLFGMPAMLLSLNNGEVPEQKDDVQYPVTAGPGLKGALTGGIVGWFPGVTATAGAVLSSTVFREKKTEGFISMTASIGSASTVFALVTLSVAGKGRTGTMLAVGDVLGDSISGMDGTFLLMLLSVAAACLLGYHMTIISGKFLSKAMVGRDIRRLNIVIIAVMVVLVALMTGVYGMILLSVSTIVGLLPTSGTVSRVHLSGCLIIPVILLRIGII